jgi:chemotaxis protein MotB
MPAIEIDPPIDPAAPGATPEGTPPVRRATSRRSRHDEPDPLLDDDTMRANWAVPWSDLMMTMFVLFAALLAMQTMNDRAQQQAKRDRPASPPQRIVEEHIVEQEKRVREEVPSRVPTLDALTRINVLARSEEALRQTDLQGAEIVLLDDQSVKVSVQGPMLFSLGKADLRPDAARFLDRLAQIIRQTPYEIRVIGHTDDLPINTALYPSNWELSLVRASQVARYLIRAGGLEPSRFVVMGRGQYEPTAANATETSRALNRRVEIVITRTVAEGSRAPANGSGTASGKAGTP